MPRSGCPALHGVNSNKKNTMILLYMDMLNKYVKWKLNLVIFAFKCWLREQIHYIKPIYDHLISLWIILSNSSSKSSSELSWRCKCNTKWELWECELLLKAQNHEFFFIFILLKNPFRVRGTDANHVKMLEVTLRATITNFLFIVESILQNVASKLIIWLIKHKILYLISQL